MSANTEICLLHCIKCFCSMLLLRNQEVLGLDVYMFIALNKVYSP